MDANLVKVWQINWKVKEIKGWCTCLHYYKNTCMHIIFLSIQSLWLALIIHLICLFQTGYSVVSACVVTLRWMDKPASQVSTRWISQRAEGIIFLLTIACCGFAAGVFYRFGASFVFMILATVIAICCAAALYLRQVSLLLLLAKGASVQTFGNFLLFHLR